MKTENSAEEESEHILFPSFAARQCSDTFDKESYKFGVMIGLNFAVAYIANDEEKILQDIQKVVVQKVEPFEE